MTKPTLINGILQTKLPANGIDGLFSTLAYFLKNFSAYLNDEGEDFGNAKTDQDDTELEAEVREVYIMMTDAFQEELGAKLLTKELDPMVYFDNDIRWLSHEEQIRAIETLEAFSGMYMKGNWSEQGVGFELLSNKAGTAFTVGMSSMGTVDGFQAEVLEVPAHPFVTKEPDTRTVYDEFAEHFAKPMRSPSHENTAPVDLEGDPLKDETAFKQVVDFFLNHGERAGVNAGTLTLSEWRKVERILRGGVFLTLMAFNQGDEDVIHASHIAHLLLNKQTKGQLAVTSYLLAQSVQAYQGKKGMHRLTEMTELLAYFNWLAVGDVDPLHEEAFSAVLALADALEEE